MLRPSGPCCVLLALSAALACAVRGRDGAALLECERLRNAWCARAVSCSSDAGTLAESERDAAFSECARAVDAALGCARAEDVSRNYDECVRDVNAAACDDVLAFVEDPAEDRAPATCAGVIRE